MVVGQENTTALASSLWLDDVYWSVRRSLVDQCILEFSKLRGEHKCLGEEPVFFVELLLHLQQIPRQMVLSR